MKTMMMVRDGNREEEGRGEEIVLRMVTEAKRREVHVMVMAF